MTRWMRKKWPRGSVAAGSRRPLSLPPTGAPPVTCCGAAGLWRTHGPRAWRTGSLPLASLPCRPLAPRAPPQAPREGGLSACAAPAVHKRIAGALALRTSDDAVRRAVARTLVTTARHQDATTRSRWPTVPGRGPMLRLVLLDARPEVHRGPRGQAGVASGRLGTWARAAAGTRSGTAGPTIGKAHLQGAFAAAAVLCRRDPPAAQQSLARLEKKHAKGKAVTIRAQTLARAVSARRTRQGAFARETCFPRQGGERRSLGPHWTPRGGTCQRRVRVLQARRPCTPRRLEVPRPCALRLAWTSARAPGLCGACRQRSPWGAPHPRLVLTGPRDALRPLCAEDGRRAQTSCAVAAHATDASLPSSLRRREPLQTCVVPPRRGCAVRGKSRQNPRASADCARNPQAETKQENPLVGVVCLLTHGGLIRVRRGTWSGHQASPCSIALRPSPCPVPPHRVCTPHRRRGEAISTGQALPTVLVPHRPFTPRLPRGFRA